MNQIFLERLVRAKYLLNNVSNAALATVNSDGSPHNTPVFLLHKKELTRLYWSSHPDSLHSKNIVRSGQIFVVLYESNVGGGLYIQADLAQELQESELETALQLHNQHRATQHKAPLTIGYYQKENGQRMYSATPQKFYINYAERDQDGRIIRDNRVEVSVSNLLED